MSGGAITGNNATKSGGAVDIVRNGSFTMDGGRISSNIAGEYGGGVSILFAIDPGAASFIMHGGTIAGNIAALGGGGVALGNAAGIFAKAPAALGGSSGIIYGNDGGDNSNTATLAASTLQNEGHAVYITTGPKTRETTVGSYQQLDSTVAGPDGGWAE
jgi:hypothetical protein